MSERDELREAFKLWSRNDGLAAAKMDYFDEFIAPLVEALDWYSRHENFEDGKVDSSDLEPATKITGSVIKYHDYPPDKIDRVWCGGRRSRNALRDLYAKLGVKHD